MSDVIVVGAGLGGLAAAIDLASSGHRVVVLEAGPRPGGKVGVTEVDGTELDTGPSLLTLPDVFDQLLRTAGTSLEAEVTLVRPPSAGRRTGSRASRACTWRGAAHTRGAGCRWRC